MSVLKNVGFAENLMIWIETETKNQEPDKTTQIFKV